RTAAARRLTTALTGPGNRAGCRALSFRGVVPAEPPVVLGSTTRTCCRGPRRAQPGARTYRGSGEADRGLPDERRCPMGADDRIEAAADKTSGKIKESVGGATDNKDMEAEGHREQAKGSLKEAGEKLKDAGQDVKDAFKK